jgi:hypothetical protein
VCVCGCAGGAEAHRSGAQQVLDAVEHWALDSPSPTISRVDVLAFVETCRRCLASGVALSAAAGVSVPSAAACAAPADVSTDESPEVAAVGAGSPSVAGMGDALAAAGSALATPPPQAGSAGGSAVMGASPVTPSRSLTDAVAAVSLSAGAAVVEGARAPAVPASLVEALSARGAVSVSATRKRSDGVCEVDALGHELFKRTRVQSEDGSTAPAAP